MHRFFKILIPFSFFIIFGIRIVAQNKVDKLLELVNIINFSYVDTINMDRLNEAAIVAMLAELDPHSVYIPKKDVKAMNESLAGSFEGIGVQFDIFRDSVVVVSAIAGGPAEKLGIHTGDILISANEQIVSGTGITDEKIIELLKGKKGTKVNVEIKRSGQDDLISYQITRDVIPIKSVDAAFMVSSEIGYLKINRFSNTTYDEFIEATDYLEDEGMKKLILDLRGNGGGYLYSAVQIADDFLDGKEVIVSTRGLRHAEQTFKAKPKGKFSEGNLVVLIDEGTASASEILAGAIQDWDRGIIMGRRSFGKGLVMKPYTLSDGSMVRLTTSRYYTPSGRCIQKDYSDSKDNYDEEIKNRYENGELYSIDSIVLPEDLKYSTNNGRTVYGGGGILPDIFHPADTLILGKRYQKILTSETILEFTLGYYEANKEDLVSSYKNEYELANDKVLTSEIINAYLSFASENDFQFQNIVKDDLKPALDIQLKAFLARYLWGEEAYYKVIIQGQEIVNQSVEVMKNWDFYWASLSQRNK